MLNAIFRPLEKWPGKPTPASERKPAPFKADYNNTLDLLEFELKQLAASNIIIQAQVAREQIRNDGWLKSNAPLAGPAVIVSFTAGFDTQTYSYPCDTFSKYAHNLRAIALALEALRKVDRYGVTRGGEQYQGFKQLPPGPQAARAALTPDQAAVWIAANVPGADAEVLRKDKGYFEAMMKLAQRKLHPDAGGTHAQFVHLQEASAVLSEHFGGKAAAGGQP